MNACRPRWVVKPAGPGVPCLTGKATLAEYEAVNKFQPAVAVQNVILALPDPFHFKGSYQYRSVYEIIQFLHVNVNVVQVKTKNQI